MAEEESRDDIIDIVNNEEPVKEAVIEPIIEEEEEEEVKPKPKPRARVKAKIKIVKEPVVIPIVEVVEEKPKKIDKLKEIVKCPDCNMDMTVHTLKYIHKRRGFCKADVKPEAVPEKTPEPILKQKPKPITEDTVNDYIKENPDIVTNYLRNERAMKAQRKQMNARSLLNNAF